MNAAVPETIPGILDWDDLLAIRGGVALDDLCGRAAEVRDSGHGAIVTYSRKVFIPLTRLCRDFCHYCTFATEPRHLDKAFLTPDEAVGIAARGRELGCKEALFTLGEKPELRHDAARRWLKERGFRTTLEYVAHVAERVLQETGLLPHINAGCMNEAEIAMLRRVSASMGIMLENVSERLCRKGQVHYGSPDKDPAVRLQTLAEAGRARVPFTTGILIGIGETRRERLESLVAISDLQREYGHIQEVIIQNFIPKADTKMARQQPPPHDEMRWTVAAARLLLGPEMSIQAPPNLNPGQLRSLVDAGINDWGGVSPLTPDHVNPESPWPLIEVLGRETAAAGKLLQERLTIYPDYLHTAERWLDPAVLGATLAQADGAGLARENDWLSGRSVDVPDDNSEGRGLALSREIPARSVSADVGELLDRLCSFEPPGRHDIARLFDARGEDFAAVCEAADALREDVCGNAVSYVVNRNINYTNICSFRCRFCAFAKGRKNTAASDKPYVKGAEEVASLAAEAWRRGATEVCLQGGIHPHFDGHTYLEICRAVHDAVPDLHIHAFSPLEVTHGAQSLGMPIRDFLLELKASGLRTLPGTAAEILSDDVRSIICPDKLNSGEWLDVVRTAHEVGLRTTATIMFGHVDRYEHWAEHLLHIRALQLQTGGITEFVPLPFVAHEAPIFRQGRARRGPTFREAVLMHAVARLVLAPALANIQTSWVKMGLHGAGVCLRAGANDLGGTLMNESITRAAGALHGQEMQPEVLEREILRHGRRPWQRTTLYRPLTAGSEYSPEEAVAGA